MVALKLLYGLDGRRRPPVPHALLPPPPAPSWQFWAASVYQRIADPCPYPLSVEQVRADDGTKPCLMLCRSVCCTVSTQVDLLQGVLQTLQLPPAEQRTYVDHLQKHIFGQAPLTPDSQELQVGLLLRCPGDGWFAGCRQTAANAEARVCRRSAWTRSPRRSSRRRSGMFLCSAAVSVHQQQAMQMAVSRLPNLSRQPLFRMQTRQLSTRHRAVRLRQPKR